MSYSIDTCAFIDARLRLYPPDVFEKFWEQFDNMLCDGTCLMSKQVLIELQQKADECADWAKQHPEVFVEVSEYWAIAREIVRQHSALAKADNKNEDADAYVIALAAKRNLTVVTSEKYSPKKIPGVCEAIGVKCVDLLGLMREQRWKF